MAVKPYKLPTINDVAAAAGVSKKTVSRVINNFPSVTSEKRSAVLKAIEELQYVPNFQARSLATGRSYLLGFVYDNPNSEYVSDLLAGVLSYCETRGYELIVRHCEGTQPSLAKNLAGLAEQIKLDGVIILPPLSERDDIAAELGAVGCSYVRIGAVALDEPNRHINCQDRKAAKQMAEHFVELGHERIGFVRGPRGYRSAAERARGFRDGLRKSGLTLDPRYVAEGGYTYESGLECGRTLLERKNPPSAIFASNDQMAQGVLRVANELGLVVPDAVALAGFDDGAVAIRAWPPLTTIRQPVSQIGELAARKLILTGAERDSIPEGIEPELVVRASTASD